MSARKFILDNRDRRVVDYLGRWLSDADMFRIGSAYFSIYGYDLLADELDGIGGVRFLFGDPSSVENLDAGEKKHRSFELVEGGLTPWETLYQKSLAKRCEEWVRRPSVGVRSVSRSRFLHGKMYLADGRGGDGAAVVGSSTFTQSGLGGGRLSNIEINLADTRSDVRDDLRDWFDDLWGDKGLTRDAKDVVLAALARLAREHSPEVIYYKTLHMLFEDEIEARDDVQADVHLSETQVWEKLYEFQKDGVPSVLSCLKRYNGCILADSVGLGKTFTALAVNKYFELSGDRVLVMCPKTLENTWTLYSGHYNRLDNPFRLDYLRYRLKAHTDLSRDEDFNWSNYDLVVIDESHHFRNHASGRYKRFMDEAIKQGRNTKVLMLSATPVNMSLIDLRNQIQLMTGGDDKAVSKIGINSVARSLNNAQREYVAWEKKQAEQTGRRRDKATLLELLGPDIPRLLTAVSTARSRRQIEQFYRQDMDTFGPFPDPGKPDNRYPDTDLNQELSYEDLSAQILKFTLSVYRPSTYLIDENFNQVNSETNLIFMLRTNFLQRLESSAYSLNETLGRTIDKISALVDRIEQFQTGQLADADIGDIRPEDDWDDDAFVNPAVRDPFLLRELNLDGWLVDLNRDRVILDAVKQQVVAVTPERDGKLKELQAIIRNKVNHPTIDQHGRPNRKLLVFTMFTDTAAYLYENLAGLADELGINMAMVSGTTNRTTIGGRNDFNSILTSFAPRARGGTVGHPTAEVDLLIGTDCISEGQDLQDCDSVVNYDIHWNPVRLIQRLGRINRIGSVNNAVRMINFWPTKDMDKYLKLESRVKARMTLADLAATGDSDPLIEKAVMQLQLDFRDEQLIEVRDGNSDLDDLDDMPSMSDLTLNYFYDQLLRYLQENKKQLDEIETGAYAVTRAGAKHPPGVVFVLRQRNSPVNGSRQQLASPVHPFYLVYVRDDGSIRYGCASTHHLLTAFEDATVDITTPITKLCDQFHRDTNNGKDMDHYNQLLAAAVADIGNAYNRAQAKGLSTSRDFRLPSVAETPHDSDAFELVTWLIIANPGHSS